MMYTGFPIPRNQSPTFENKTPNFDQMNSIDYQSWLGFCYTKKENSS